MVNVIASWVLLVALDVLLFGVALKSSSLDVESPFAIDEADGELSTTELARKYGHQVESHEVQTADGYILSLTRIPPRNGSNAMPVLLVHGLLANSADFLIIGPDHALAYLLADSGYDVWLGDVRGNRYSRQHAHLSPDSKEYWDFSWHEMGYYDLPALMDYVLAHNGAQKLFYIGHSQGVLLYFVMASCRPEYNNKVALVQGLAPAGRHTRLQNGVLRWIEKNVDNIQQTSEVFDMYGVFTHKSYYYKIAKALCAVTDPDSLCVKLLNMMEGTNTDNLDTKAFFIRLGHWPDGMSMKQLVHYAQASRCGKLCQYDYGELDNLVRYGNSEPPCYNLTAITAPIVLYYGLQDGLIDHRDVVEFGTQLPNLVSMSPVEGYTHLDFIIARNVRSVVYEQILRQLAVHSILTG